MLLVAAGRLPAVRAFPGHRDHHVGREEQLTAVTTGAPVGDRVPGHRLTSFVGTDRPGADPYATDGVATCHGCSLLSWGDTTRLPGGSGPAVADRVSLGRRGASRKLLGDSLHPDRFSSSGSCHPD